MSEHTKNFRVIRMKNLPSKVGLQPSTIYGLIAKGEFPAPFNLLRVAEPQGGWSEPWTNGWKSVRQDNGKVYLQF